MPDSLPEEIDQRPSVLVVGDRPITEGDARPVRRCAREKVAVLASACKNRIEARVNHDVPANEGGLAADPAHKAWSLAILAAPCLSPLPIGETIRDR